MRNSVFFQILTRLAAVLSILILVLTAYLVLARPSQLTWGASDSEIRQAMPGDHLEPPPEFFATRAITIAGTPEQIWPWLLQMGYGRAGYYGFDIIENLGSPGGIHSAEQILPEYQRFKVGDDVPISAVANMVFYAIEPDRYLIWTGANGQGSFLWALYPLDEGHTRLVSRIRWSFNWSEPKLLALDMFTEFTDYLAVREILYGVKGRVENQRQSMAEQNIRFAGYVTAALIFIAALGLILIRPLSARRWLTGLAAGLAWLVIWYTAVPVWLGVGAEIPVLSLIFGRIPLGCRKMPLRPDGRHVDPE